MGNVKNKTFSYHFIGMGSVITEKKDFFIVNNPERPNKPDEYKKNKTVFLDVGNALKKGIIDTHHLTEKIKIEEKEYSSATGVLANDLSLLDLVKNSNEICFIVHIEPDLDCMASVYLAQEYLINGRLPQYYEVLVDYVELVDSGKMKLSNKNHKTAFAIINALNAIKNDDGDKLKTGIDYINNWLEDLKKMTETERNLDPFAQIILENSSQYEKELELLEEDYKKYVSERDNPTVCVKQKIRLPNMYKKGQLEEVDGLFWRKVPECKLHKYWARQDEDSPSRKGFTFTFIPQYLGEAIGYDKADHLNSIGIDTSKIELNRIIISVDPNSKVNLKALAEKLEDAERKEEEELFGENYHKKNIWRDYNKQRFDEEWCKNDDPWYDGRSFSYTIIDSPRTGSLLSLDQIEEIVSKYMKPIVLDNNIRFVNIFSYDSEEVSYEKLRNYLKRNHAPKIFEEKEYFLDYIREYFFENDDNCAHFDLENLDCIKNILNGAYNENDDKSIKFDIKNCSITIFKYNVGIISVEVELKHNPSLDSKLYFEQLLDFNNTICQNKNFSNELTRAIFYNIKSASDNIKSAAEMPLVCCYVEVDPKLFVESEKNEMLYKLCNAMNWNEPFTQCQYEDEIVKNNFVELETNVMYGVCKSGFALLIGTNRKDNETLNNKIDQIKNNFLGTDYIIFLLAHHHRDILMNFSNKLSIYSKEKNIKQVNNLRNQIMDYTIHGWFSQITKNEIGMNLFSRWLEVLQIDILYEEVFSQVTAVDKFNKDKLREKVEIVSLILVPLVILSTILDLGFVNIDGIIDISGNSWMVIGAILFALYGLMYFKILDK